MSQLDQATLMQLARNYKRIVVKRVLGALGQGLTYTPESRFTKQDFLDMDVFAKLTDTWAAEDEICGRRNAVTYSILEAPKRYGRSSHPRSPTRGEAYIRTGISG